METLPASPSPAVRCLLARKSVDDRALNRHVFGLLARALAKRPAGAPLRVLEAGAGAGIMLTRLMEWRLFERARYTLLEPAPEKADYAPQWWRRWAKTWNGALKQKRPGVYLLQHGQQRVRARLRLRSLEDHLERARTGRYDLLIAHDFLPAVEAGLLLPRMMPLLRPGGYAWFTANCDGALLCEPGLSQVDEPALLARYARQAAPWPARRLLTLIRDCGARLLAAGSSDSVLFADERGAYPADERFYLARRLEAIRETLRADPGVDAAALSDWYALRRSHLEAGSLVFVSHRLDILAQTAG